MGKNTTTKRPLTADELKEHVRAICGVDRNASQVPAFGTRCPNPVTWLCTSDGGHTLGGYPTLQEWFACDEHASKVDPQ